MKCPSSTLLKSSTDLGWPFLSAELRAHHPYKGFGAAALPDAEVGILVRGSDEGLLAYKFAGGWQSARPLTGSLLLRPIELTCDEADISANVEILHLAVPAITFTRLAEDFHLPPEQGRFIRHSCGVQDELIHQIGLSVLSEMTSPTAASRMLVDTSSLLLAARLANAHSEIGCTPPTISSRHGLDDGRLRRVLAYLEEHLSDDITVADLSNVANLSMFHFSRAFAAAMGMPPHRYVSQRRLERAKAMIASGRASLAEIAHFCQFSSQSSFTRAFRRTTGMTPAEYRRTLR